MDENSYAPCGWAVTMDPERIKSLIQQIRRAADDFQKILLGHHLRDAIDGQASDSTVLHELLALLRHGDEFERIAATMALKRLGDPRAALALLEEKTRLRDGFTKDREGKVPEVVVDGAPSQNATFDALLELLTGQESKGWSWAEYAAEALTRLGDPRAAEVLAKYAVHRGGSGSRAAVMALAKLGERNRLRELMQFGDSYVREFVAEAFVAMGPGALADLESLAADSKVEVRIAAVRAIASFRTDEATIMITRALADPVGIVRAVAIKCIASCATTSSLALILEALRDPDSIVREAAVRSLGDLQSPEAVPLLCNILADASLRRYALEALEKVADSTAIESILAVLGNHNLHEYEVTSISRFLGRIGDARALRVLQVRALHRDPLVTQTALEKILARSAAEATTEDLQDLVAQEDVAYTVTEVYIDDDGDMMGRDHERVLDCSTIRKLAAAELDRRKR